MAYERTRTVQPPYVYHLEVDGLIYVGQSEATTENRIDTHFRNAYYHEGAGNGETNKIYARMRHFCLKDINIDFYTPENGWGFGNKWPQIKSDFLEEWVPIGKRCTNNNGLKDCADLQDIDLAEILHILRLTYEHKTLTNRQMGGKITGFTATGFENKDAILQKTMTPDEALSVCFWGKDQAIAMKQAIKQIYQDMFEDDWPIRLEKYRQDWDGPFTEVSNRLLNQIKGTWIEFFNQRLLPIILSFSGHNSRIELEKRKETIKKIFNKEFLTPRQEAVEALFNYYMKQQKIQAPLSVDRLDFTLLDEYLYQVLSNWLVKYWKNTKSLIINGQDISRMAAHFKPVRITAIWDTRIPRIKRAGGWIKDNPITTSIPMTEDEKKTYSVNMFQKAFLEVKDPEIINAIPRHMHKNTFIGDIETIDMQSLTSTDWLSARMAVWYQDHAPAYYNNGWWAFYRPMVAYWRQNRHGEKAFLTLNTAKTNYLITQEEPALKYSEIQNFVLESTWADIIIY